MVVCGLPLICLCLHFQGMIARGGGTIMLRADGNMTIDGFVAADGANGVTPNATNASSRLSSTLASSPATALSTSSSSTLHALSPLSVSASGPTSSLAAAPAAMNGGGAGGTIVIRVGGLFVVTSIYVSAQGGDGNAAGGGGGGGGRIALYFNETAATVPTVAFLVAGGQSKTCGADAGAGTILFVESRAVIGASSSFLTFYVMWFCLRRVQYFYFTAFNL
jgi:hypothetical protein